MVLVSCKDDLSVAKPNIVWSVFLHFIFYYKTKIFSVASEGAEKTKLKTCNLLLDDGNLLWWNEAIVETSLFKCLFDFEPVIDSFFYFS